MKKIYVYIIYIYMLSERLNNSSNITQTNLTKSPQVQQVFERDWIEIRDAGKIRQPALVCDKQILGCISLRGKHLTQSKKVRRINLFIF